MKEQYIRQVEKELKVPRNRKREILRDLQEAFASALEHGETEAQVIQRLGTPKEFANSTAEQLGVDPVRGKKRKQLLAGLLCLVVAAAAFAGYAAGQLSHAGGCHRPGGRHDQYPGDRGAGHSCARHPAGGRDPLCLRGLGFPPAGGGPKQGTTMKRWTLLGTLLLALFLSGCGQPAGQTDAVPPVNTASPQASCF